MPSQRFDRIDALRALAMAWMTLFHFCYDLNYFGYWKQAFLTDPFWTWQRTGIVSLFLFCAGLGQAVAVHQGQSWPRFWKRWAQVAGAALLVSLGSALMFPRTFIYFGVLHGIAVMLLIVRLTAAWDRRWLLLVGAAAIASKFVAPLVLGEGAAAELFNGRALNWLGWITKKPVTEDYVPLLPWLGVMWWGMAAGSWLLARRPHWLQSAARGPARRVARLGRYSLSYYLLHQPVLIGALMAFGWASRQM
ncbi:MAG TPA: heparan-alpha-glucosaminide N-acetyltransferase [Burkholderiaceae bacterium]|nr:heparan-alpha-glucosaminide N-acetyltransferase [Burkholderiaceae bacterium]